MTMRQLANYLGAAVVLILTTSCHTGPSAKKFGPVQKGGGTTVTIRLLHRERLRGELVEVRDSGLMLLNGCTLTAVPFSSIRDTHFDGIDPEYGSSWPSPSERAELQLLSRFPSGIPAAVAAEFARCAGRPTPTGIGRGTASAPNAEQFLAAARAGTERYGHLDSAIAAGYRRIGADLPSQGEHWVHAALVMSGRIDPARPTKHCRCSTTTASTQPPPGHRLGLRFSTAGSGRRIRAVSGSPTIGRCHLSGRDSRPTMCRSQRRKHSA